jgi:hypothetical protein
LKKLKIIGYKDEKFTSKVSGEEGEFEVQINPTDYKISMKPPVGKEVNTGEYKVTGEPITRTDFHISERTVSLKFYLDSTGVLKGNDIESVQAAASSLKSLCVDYQGSIHNSFFLQIEWDSIILNCKCDSLEINYLLFNSDGKAVRAEVNASFTEFIDEETKIKLKNSSSPDMTHLRTIKSGDSLPALCEEIYGSSKYYLQVAKANGIINFRNIQPGKQVLFPRLEK